MKVLIRTEFSEFGYFNIKEIKHENEYVVLIDYSENEIVEFEEKDIHLINVTMEWN